MDAEKTESMKAVTVVVHQTQISRLFPQGFQLLLKDNADALDSIKVVDVEIGREPESSPSEATKACFKWFTTRVRTGSTNKSQSKQAQILERFLNVRENPKMSLPNETTIVLVSEGGCTADWKNQLGS